MKKLYGIVQELRVTKIICLQILNELHVAVIMPEKETQTATLGGPVIVNAAPGTLSALPCQCHWVLAEDTPSQNHAGVSPIRNNETDISGCIIT